MKNPRNKFTMRDVPYLALFTALTVLAMLATCALLWVVWPVAS